MVEFKLRARKDFKMNKQIYNFALNKNATIERLAVLVFMPNMRKYNFFQFKLSDYELSNL